jgi:hypothetical protein
MNNSRILAPKPIRKVPSSLNIKVDNYLSNVALARPANSVKTKKSFNWTKHNIDPFSPSTNSVINLTLFTGENVEEELYEEEMKSEILSILGRNESTWYKSFDIGSEFDVNTNEYLKIDFSEADSNKIPVRSSNPLIKNFSEEDIELDLSSKKFNSDNCLLGFELNGNLVKLT